jgi:hypothetical protein
MLLGGLHHTIHQPKTMHVVTMPLDRRKMKKTGVGTKFTKKELGHPL